MGNFVFGAYVDNENQGQPAYPQSDQGLHGPL